MKQTHKNILAQDSWLVLNRGLMKKLGVDAAVLISYLVDQQNFYRQLGKLENGYFFKTKPEIEEETCLSPFKQKLALKVLEDMEVVTFFLKKCVQPKFFYKVNEEKLNGILENLHKVKE